MISPGFLSWALRAGSVFRIMWAWARLFLSTCITLHLPILRFICHLFAYFLSLVRCTWSSLSQSLFSLTSNPSHSVLSYVVSFPPLPPKQTPPVSPSFPCLWRLPQYSCPWAPARWLSFPSSPLTSCFNQHLHHTLPAFSPVPSFLFCSSYTHLLVSQSLYTHLLSNSPHIVSFFLQKWLIPVYLSRQSPSLSKTYSLYLVLFPTHFTYSVIPSNCSPEYDPLSPNLRGVSLLLSLMLHVQPGPVLPLPSCVPQPLLRDASCTSFSTPFFPSGPGVVPCVLMQIESCCPAYQVQDGHGQPRRVMFPSLSSSVQFHCRVVE